VHHDPKYLRDVDVLENDKQMRDEVGDVVREHKCQRCAASQQQLRIVAALHLIEHSSHHQGNCEEGDAENRFREGFRKTCINCRGVLDVNFERLADEVDLQFRRLRDQARHLLQHEGAKGRNGAKRLHVAVYDDVDPACDLRILGCCVTVG